MTRRAWFATFGALALGSAAAAQDGPTGACCFSNAACFEFTEAFCDTSHGTYVGDGVECGAIKCACTADLDGSAEVSFGDLLIILFAWGPCPACLEDLNGDDVVDILDLLAVLPAWGVCDPAPVVIVQSAPPTVVLRDVSVEVGAPAGLTAWRVSVLSSTATDSVLAVFTHPTLGSTLSFETDDPDGLRNDCPTKTHLEDFPDPSCEPYDSWVVIGDPIGHETIMTPGLFGGDGSMRVIEGTSFEETSGGWFDSDPGSVESGTVVDIAQFTVGSAFSVRLEGAVAWRPEGLPGYLVTAFEPPIVFDPPEEVPAAGEPTIEATGDFDGDGTADLIVAIPALDAVQVFLNLGNDERGVWLGYAAVEPPTSVGADPRGVAVGHFDDDEHLDAVVTNNDDNDISILINDGLGAGTFETPVDIAVGMEPFGVAVEDIVGDASLDIAVVNRTSGPSGTVRILRGDGSGNFEFDQELLAGQGARTVCPHDLDNEKDIEMIIGNEGDGTIWVYPREGGVFLDPIILPVGAAPIDLTIGDFDGNGFDDIASANFGDDSVAFLLNHGDDTFDPAVFRSVGVQPQSVDAVDLDDDGKPDIAVVVDDPEAVQTLRNATEGQLDFSDPVPFGVDADPNFVVSADVNDDGRSDLITVNADDAKSEGSVSVLLNASPLASVTGDVDGDGDVDFADLLLVLGAWGPCPDCPEDLDGDGVVTFSDLLIVLGNWAP